MRRKRIAAGGCWPTPLQRLLLEASLLADDRALAAWERWKAQVDLDALDFGSRQLLPLLYRNLVTLGVTDPLLAKIKGVYRHTWFVNQRLVRAVVPLMQRLQSAGVPTLALKGIALVEEYYGDRGLRPMSDADILVPGPQVRPAVRILMEDGWMPRRKGNASPPDRHLLYKNAQAHFRPDGLAVDLRWHLLPECCHPHDDDACWSRADRMSLDAVETLCLDPSTQFLHTLLHGVKWSPVPPLRWIADAWWILQQRPLAMDWDYILAETRRRQMTLP
ncbi:MAG: nucleotidyltransferase family protein, partial [Acidobacteria bacterium]|nr:nucleotidyltransferase family protein [Acidobacteriota bacterium]